MTDHMHTFVTSTQKKKTKANEKCKNMMEVHFKFIPISITLIHISHISLDTRNGNQVRNRNLLIRFSGAKWFY